ncbi:MAG: hypothetical protein AB7O56_10735 [Bauldia sp.]
MTTINPISVTCAVCGTTSEQQRLANVESYGWPDLDLRPPEMRRSTMPVWLQDCPSCGFVAPDLAKASDADKAALDAPAWRELVAARDGAPLANRFERRALIEGATAQAGLAAYRFLCAAWDADDRDDADSASAYRSQAAASFIEALDEMPDAKEATDWTIQLVDVLRRIGRFDEAEAYCDRLIGNALPKVDAIARFQIRMILEGDSARYTMAIAMEEA